MLPEKWHSVALRSDGTVVAWGDNSKGQTSIPAGLKNVVAIDAKQNHSAAILADGTMVHWGEIEFVKNIPAPDLKEISSISLGYLFSGAILPKSPHSK